MHGTLVTLSWKSGLACTSSNYLLQGESTICKMMKVTKRRCVDQTPGATVEVPYYIIAYHGYHGNKVPGRYLEGLSPVRRVACGVCLTQSYQYFDPCTLPISSEGCVWALVLPYRQLECLLAHWLIIGSLTLHHTFNAFNTSNPEHPPSTIIIIPT